MSELLTNHRRKNLPRYDTFTSALVLDRSFGANLAMGNGNEVLHVECENPVDVRVTRVARELARHKLDIVGVKRQIGHVMTRGLYFFRWKGRKSAIGNRILHVCTWQNSISS